MSWQQQSDATAHLLELDPHAPVATLSLDASIKPVVPPRSQKASGG